MIEIKTVAGKVLYTAASASDVRAALVEAVKGRAYLGGAYLRGANLRDADLRDANLRGADLGGAYLRGADLRDAYLGGAYLRDADLRDAYLGGAYLRGAYLRGADLGGAYLRGADLRDAYLRDANLGAAKNAETAIAQTIVCPKGDVIGWKNCQGGRIVKLRIPADAARSNASGRKCRAERAEVLAIYAKDGTDADRAVSRHDPDFAYRVGETVTPTEPFDTDRWNECAAGIHFYITREEAEAHL
ncbi:hypothetical protein ABW16_21395 [Mycolicibacter heraklionensis]|uniref:Pentapeptide repeat-containing protein n=1 Tax=Mycolicibacter heraklionensis TaxID=512402 RepID=A0ABR5FA66_9MYCO|nr:pentapeptide repeat-containing protein [Mycolicibacter heraklionensis]KLO25874.1 hypothetical protein ABW16_21395 [Mycolicibacter heraklionensis]